MNDFTWCDLSTFDVDKARAFYERVFGWSYRDDAGYLTARAGRQPAAGLYLMPDVYRDMGLPSFWMSYIRVENLDEKADTAVALGAIQEVPPTAFDSRSRFALVRDPSGAGFTLYEGPDLAGRGSAPGRLLWNELQLDRLDTVAAFYEGLLGWQFTKDTDAPGRYLVESAGSPVASIQEIDPALKGRFNYWMVFFRVADLATATQEVQAAGGTISYSDRTYALCADDQGAAFAVTEG